MPATINQTFAAGLEPTDLATSGSWPAQWSAIARVPAPGNWLFDALTEIRQLKTLEENWDGYGSPPIWGQVVETTVSLLDRFARESDQLPVPEVAPVTGGGLHLEFEIGPKGLEIEVLPDTSIQVLISEGDVEEELPMLPERLNVTAVAAWLLAEV